jgi:hypothetical protein
MKRDDMERRTKAEYVKRLEKIALKTEKNGSFVNRTQ